MSLRSAVQDFGDRLAGVETRSWQPPAAPYGVTRYGTAGAHVTYDRSLAHGAVYACVDLLVRLVVWQMPVSVTANGAPIPAPGVVANPHPEPQLTAKHWRAAALESAMMRGYAAGMVTEWERTSWPSKILPVHPDKVTWAHRNGAVEWKVGGKPAELWQLGGDLWVAPGIRVTAGQPVGISPLAYAASEIGLGLSARQFGSDYFDAGGPPIYHGKVTTPDGTLPQATAEALKDRILEATRNRQPLITGSAFDLNVIPVNAEESQFLQTIQANVATVCMFFGVPPESIGGTSGSSLTYATVEGRNLQLLTNTAGTWMQWFEDTLAALTPGPVTVTLDPEELLRTSVPTLFKTAETGARTFLTINESRAMVGYPPVDGGDTLPPAGTTPGAPNAPQPVA